MKAYVVRRVLLIIPTLFLLSILVVLSARFIPGDIVDTMVASDQNAMYGVPTDVNRARTQTDGQHFAEFVHANMPTVDGVLYQSRFTAHDCLAVFDRGIRRLQVDRLVSVDRDLVANALESWNVKVR